VAPHLTLRSQAGRSSQGVRSRGRRCHHRECKTARLRHTSGCRRGFVTCPARCGPLDRGTVTSYPRSGASAAATLGQLDDEHGVDAGVDHLRVELGEDLENAERLARADRERLAEGPIPDCGTKPAGSTTWSFASTRKNLNTPRVWRPGRHRVRAEPGRHRSRGQPWRGGTLGQPTSRRSAVCGEKFAAAGGLPGSATSHSFTPAGYLLGRFISAYGQRRVAASIWGLWKPGWRRGLRRGPFLAPHPLCHRSLARRRGKNRNVFEDLLGRSSTRISRVYSPKCSARHPIAAAISTPGSSPG
jgi:hypothetical protein